MNNKEIDLEHFDFSQFQFAWLLIRVSVSSANCLIPVMVTGRSFGSDATAAENNDILSEMVTISFPSP